MTHIGHPVEETFAPGLRTVLHVDSPEFVALEYEALRSAFPRPEAIELYYAIRQVYELGPDDQASVEWLRQAWASFSKEDADAPHD